MPLSAGRRLVAMDAKKIVSAAASIAGSVLGALAAVVPSGVETSLIELQLLAGAQGVQSSAMYICELPCVLMDVSWAVEEKVTKRPKLAIEGLVTSALA